MVSSSSLAPVAAATAAAVWVYLWVSTPMTTSTRSARLGIAFTPLVRMGTCMVPVRLEDGTTVMGHDPADTGDGHAPDQASNSGRAGAGRRTRTSPREGTRASQIKGHAPVCRPQPTAPRAAGTTLTVRSAVFDDPSLVSSAGLVPMLALARSAGLGRLADQHLSVPTDKGANPGVEGRLAGGRDGRRRGQHRRHAVLRHGGMGKVFTSAYAPSTLGSFLRSFTFGHVRQLDAVSARFLSGLAATTPVVAGIDDQVMVD